MLLSSLDQYARNYLPQWSSGVPPPWGPRPTHYGGFRPQAYPNINAAGPVPTAATTQGAVNLATTQRAIKPFDKGNFRSSEAGTLSFFQGGSVSVSDNGKANAQRYYHTTRPREGLPRIFYPSRTTESGYAFELYLPKD